MSRNFERALLLLAGALSGVVGVALLRGGLLPLTQSVASLEDQKRCAEQAQAFFRQVQQDDANWPDAELVQNRYDPVSGVCFVRVSSYKASDPVDQFRDEVADAFTGRDYAEALIYQGEAAPNVAFCWVLDGSGQPQSCKTSEEYLHLIDRYLP
ncbi:MAG TPA: hypothetical protein VKS20_06190 [Candidatus Acidoferrales bacterium]|nr:hypothetical protein [Candidatus Acidoferrales bacterium]